MKKLLHPDLSRLTTIRLGGHAKFLTILECEKDLTRLQEIIEKSQGNYFWLGQGSNLICQDGDWPLILVQIQFNEEPLIIEESYPEVKVKAGSGTRLPALLRFCLKNSLSGLEGLCGIPGSVGGAIAMNAGSFGQEIGNVLESVSIWNGKEIKSFNKTELGLGYRCISFPEPIIKPLILSGIFTLTRTKKNDIFNRMNHNFIEKKSKQPIEAHSAGCVFKNPPDGPPAGFLLDKAGMRGKRLGGMAFSDKHANFLINVNNGTSREALDLLDLGKNAVRKKFGIILHPEVQIIPALSL